MSAVVYVACQNTADAWDVCRVEDLVGHCELVSQPIIFGLRTEQAFEYVAKLNDDLAWAKKARYIAARRNDDLKWAKELSNEHRSES